MSAHRATGPKKKLAFGYQNKRAPGGRVFRVVAGSGKNRPHWDIWSEVRDGPLYSENAFGDFLTMRRPLTGKSVAGDFVPCFDALCDHVVAVLSEKLRPFTDSSRAALVVHDRRAESQRNDDQPTFELAVTPADRCAPAISVVIWPTADLLVTIGRNGASIELDQSAGDGLIHMVEQLADCVLDGRLIDRVELDDESNVVAVRSSLFAADGTLLFDLESFEGGSGSEIRIDRYASYRQGEPS